MTRGGRKKDRDTPERRCIVTGETGPKQGLIRFVVGPDDTVVPDLAERLPGRGIWVTADRAALDRAVVKGLFARGARRAVRAADDLPDLVERLLAERIVGLVSMARKAGEAVAGYEKVRALLIDERAACLLQAADGSAREKARLRPPDGENAYFADLTAAELGLAFGRERVIHAALVSGGLARLIGYESARLTGIRRHRA